MDSVVIGAPFVLMEDVCINAYSILKKYATN